jgi:hypothetical protein
MDPKPPPLTTKLELSFARNVHEHDIIITAGKIYKVKVIKKDNGVDMAMRHGSVELFLRKKGNVPEGLLDVEYKVWMNMLPSEATRGKFASVQLTDWAFKLPPRRTVAEAEAVVKQLQQWMYAGIRHLYKQIVVLTPHFQYNALEGAPAEKAFAEDFDIARIAQTGGILIVFRSRVEEKLIARAVAAHANVVRIEYLCRYCYNYCNVLFNCRFTG